MTDSQAPATSPAGRTGHHYGATSSGLEPELAAALSYLAGWLSGALFLLLERDNRFVRFHAMQSVVGLGGLFVVLAVLSIVGVFVLFVSAALSRVVVWSIALTWAISLILWLVCMVKAYLGEVWKAPLIGGLAERLLNRGIPARS